RNDEFESRREYEQRALAGLCHRREALCHCVCGIVQFTEGEDRLFGATICEEHQRALLALRRGAMLQDGDERGKIHRKGPTYRAAAGCAPVTFSARCVDKSSTVG